MPWQRQPSRPDIASSSQTRSIPARRTKLAAAGEEPSHPHSQSVPGKRSQARALLESRSRAHLGTPKWPRPHPVYDSLWWSMSTSHFTDIEGDQKQAIASRKASAWACGSSCSSGCHRWMLKPHGGRDIRFKFQYNTHACTIVSMLSVMYMLYIYIYVCMYVCMYVCIYVCMYVCMHGCACNDVIVKIPCTNY